VKPVDLSALRTPTLATAPDPLRPNMPAEVAAYAAAGWAILPLHSAPAGRCTCGNEDCASPAKHPRTSNGFKDASTELDQLAVWWKRWPGSNVGIAVPGTHVVVDIDGPAGMEALADYELPLTAFAETGKGYHLVYTTDVPIRPKVAVLDHVDIRGEGSYIVAAPSVHSNGKAYKWITPLADAMPAPDWVTQMASSRRALVAAAGASVGEGARNAHLTSLAGSMRKRGMSSNALAAALLAENAERCSPPLADQEVRAIATSVSRYEPELVMGNLTTSARQPVIERLDDIEVADADPPMALDPLVLDEGPSVLFGDGETFKSLIAHAVAATVAGRSDICESWRANVTGPVLWADWEGNRRRTARRRLKIGNADIFYVQCAGPIWDLTDYLANFVRQEGVELLVVDSIIPAIAGNLSPYDPTPAARFYNSVNTICTRSLSIGHVTKDGKQDDKPFGSAYFHNLARLTMRSDRSSDDDSRTKLVNCKHSDGPRLPDVEYEFDWSDRLTIRTRNLRLDTRTLTAIVVELVGETRSPDATREAIEQTVRNKGYTVGRSWLNNLLKDCVSTRMLLRTHRGAYRPDHGAVLAGLWTAAAFGDEA
jgi:hypothetical protein